MTKADRETLTDLRDAVAEINDELESAMDDLVELKARIEALREQKRWRVGAIKFIKAGKPVTR
jgi:predicted  nucleic acid-binding Zn-ribbon protein